jgi:hypothetical protein
MMTAEQREQQQRGLVPFRTREDAVAGAKKSAAVRQAKALVRGGKPATRLAPGEWQGLYVEQAFAPRWQAYYCEVRKALQQEYAPTGDKERPQYRILVQNVATLETLVAAATAQGAYGDQLDKWRDQLRWYVQALQKYSEGQKHLDEMVYEERVRTVEGFVGIAESVLVGHPQLMSTLAKRWTRFLSPKAAEQLDQEDELQRLRDEVQQLRDAAARAGADG